MLRARAHALLQIYLSNVAGEGGRRKEKRRVRERESEKKKDEGNITPTFRTSSLDPPLARERVWVCRSSVAHAPIHQDHVKATFLNQTACHLFYLSVFYPILSRENYHVPIEIEIFPFDQTYQSKIRRTYFFLLSKISLLF